MRQADNEKGYALIIVLFAIVFITVLTAVFMKGSLNNKVQEKTVDENNLVVVAAEAGVDFYKWEFDEVYRTADLAGKFDLIANSLPKELANPEEHNKVRLDLAEEFIEMLNEKAQSMIAENAEKMDGKGVYTHKLISAVIPPIDRHGIPPEDSVFINVEGEVEGEITDRDLGNNNKKVLGFLLSYEISPVQIKDSDMDGGNPDTEVPPKEPGNQLPDIQSPDNPVLPELLIGITKTCGSTVNLQDAECKSNGANIISHSFTNSKVIVNGSLESWGNIGIKSGSILNVSNAVKTKDMALSNSQLKVNGLIDGYGRLDFSGSIIQSANFGGKETSITNVSMTVNNNLTSGLFEATGSKLHVGGTLSTGGGLFYAKNSSVTIDGNADTHNGSTLEGSKLSIKGNYNHTSKPVDAKNTDIFVGGNMTATNGTNFDNVKIIVNGKYDSSTRFYINKTHFSTGGELWMGNGGTFEGSQLSAGNITSKTTVDFKDTIAYTGKLKSDVMKMTSSKVCVTDLDVRSLTISSNSEIYYSNTSNQTGSNIFKVPALDFNKKCGAKYEGSETLPDIPDTEKEKVEIVPKPPAMKEVVY